MSYRTIFRDPDTEWEFSVRGYFTQQLLDPDDISYLLGVFRLLKPDVERQFYSTIESKNLEYRRKADEQIRNRISDKVASRFINYSPVIFNFIVKKPHGNNEVAIHADHTAVDETRFQAVNIWCPLVDTTPHNGALFVLPGSQTFIYPPRGFGIPSPYNEFNELIKPRMKMLPLKAGEAVFYNNKLMHRSDSNISNTSRPAIITCMVPNEAPKIIHFRTPEIPNDKVEVFELSREFYLNFDLNKRPENFRSLGVIDYKAVNPTREEFIRMLGNIENEKSVGNSVTGQ